MHEITEGRTIHWARIYDLGCAFFRSRSTLYRGLIDLSGIASGDRVLDVGCGPGVLTRAAAHVVGPRGECKGIDPSPEMIALAKSKGARTGNAATFEIAAAEAIPSPECHYDAVVASLVLHHLSPDLQKRALAEVLRVLKPNGRFVALDFSAEAGHGLGHILSVLGLRQGSGHAEHLKSLVSDSGFASVEIVPAPKRAFSFISARKPGTRH